MDNELTNTWARINPIRILKLWGLGGRIFLIKQEQQGRLSKITSNKQFKHLMAGQGYDWLDSYILSGNNYSLIKGLGHNTLQYCPFDSMSRVLCESWNKPKMFAGWIITSITLSFILLFFVHNDNPRLKERREAGLIKSKNSSFKYLFDNYPITKNMLCQQNWSEESI